MVQWLGTLQAGGTGWTPGRGAKIAHAATKFLCSQINKFFLIYLQKMQEWSFDPFEHLSFSFL